MLFKFKDMITLTKKEQAKIIKAKKLIDEALLVLNYVDNSNESFRYDGNRNFLFNRLDGVRSIVDELAENIK